MELNKIGIVPAKEKQLNKKGIYTVEDLTTFFPRKYNDFSKETGILSSDQISCIIVHIDDVKFYNNKTPLIIASGREKITNNKVKVMWFRKQFMFNKLYNTIGYDVYVCGKAIYSEDYKNYTISEPLLYTTHIVSSKRIYPVYSKINRMSEEYLEEHIRYALEMPGILKDLMPKNIVTDEGLMPLDIAIKELHNPSNISNLTKAQNRIVFDDLMYFALRLQQNNRKRMGGSSYNIKTLTNFYKVLNNLPFSLTEDQDKTVKTIINQMRTGKVRALIEGNVSCGKTLVAELCMIAMSDNGYQSALMAPTKILAKQHYDDIVKLVSPYGLNVAFYEGNNMKAKDKREMLEKIKNGYYHFIIGTHSLTGKEIEFNNLGLFISDEEHKYGTIQKDSIYEKSTPSLHTISMSATPIPRSIATILYGDDIQIYHIKSMPSIRKPVKTYITNKQNKVFNFIYKQIKDGHQVYVMCPIIDQSEKLEGVASIEEMSELYKTSFEPLGISVGVLTGRNPKDEAEQIIDDYRNGKIDILVCSQIVEVGVSNNNSTVMVIHSPDRLGLASLHQIRGRVGRGSAQSYCILFTDDVNNERLKILASTNDGYKIALYDLKNRKTGDLIGTEQSGSNKYVELMLTHAKLYDHIKELASTLLDTGEADEFLNYKIFQNEKD